MLTTVSQSCSLSAAPRGERADEAALESLPASLPATLGRRFPASGESLDMTLCAHSGGWVATLCLRRRSCRLSLHRSQPQGLPNGGEAAVARHANWRPCAAHIVKSLDGSHFAAASEFLGLAAAQQQGAATIDGNRGQSTAAAAVGSLCLKLRACV